MNPGGHRATDVAEWIGPELHNLLSIMEKLEREQNTKEAMLKHTIHTDRKRKETHRRRARQGQHAQKEERNKRSGLIGRENPDPNNF